MKKAIKVALIFGWFFAFQHSFEGKAIVKGEVGPFDDKKQCNEAREEIVALIYESGLSGQVDICVHKQEM